MQKRYLIKVKGIVQGVGFRPFIYNLAHKLNLVGQVSNTSEGVTIDVEGASSSLEFFIGELQNYPPPLADIQSLSYEERPVAGYDSFSISFSDGEQEKQVLISPDVSICADCLEELLEPGNRRYLYPFINCTNCGPRFTIIEDVPYDRPFTTMKHFPMCNSCLKEYENPDDRRFHAQPNACKDCGPWVSLFDSGGEPVQCLDALAHTAWLLEKGFIIAIKGIGGYHLACDARKGEAVKRLRSRKFREDKPFAVMCRDLREVRRYCSLETEEAELLSSSKRPIVLLRKGKEAFALADALAPENDYLGVMLPYSPLHYVLFQHYNKGPLVMTSANVSDEPIAYEDKDAFGRLKDIADYFLTHNREIRHRCDDSVTRIFEGKEYLIRRSRGYAPAPILLEKEVKTILACGGEQKNTFCLTKGIYAFVSHHIGDLENLETLESFTEGINLYKRLFDIEPEIVAYDLHPEYLSTKFATQINKVQKVGVQHHHAHIVSCMAENRLRDAVIGVAFDGTGYGTDGHIWGGEFLLATYKDFRRIGHLKYIPMPGGSRAIKEPWRMIVSWLLQIGDLEDFKGLEFIREIGFDNALLLKEIIDKRINIPLTSSMGRLFDAVSALLNIRTRVNYEGQAAVKLEQKALQFREKTATKTYNFSLNCDNGIYEVDPRPIIVGILESIEMGASVEEIAVQFHHTVAEIVLRVCEVFREQENINKVCLSGGVFQNLLLLELTLARLRKKGFQIYTHRQLPTNDGGVSFGQAVIANERS